MRSQLAKMLKPRHEREGINKYFIAIKRNRCKQLNQRSSIYQPKIQEILTISVKYQKIIFFLRWYYVHKPTLTPPYPPTFYCPAEAPQQGSTCCQPTRHNVFQSFSGASLRGAHVSSGVVVPRHRNPRIDKNLRVSDPTRLVSMKPLGFFGRRILDEAL